MRFGVNKWSCCILARIGSSFLYHRAINREKVTHIIIAASLLFRSVLLGVEKHPPAWQGVRLRSWTSWSAVVPVTQPSPMPGQSPGVQLGWHLCHLVSTSSIGRPNDRKQRVVVCTPGVPNGELQFCQLELLL